MVHAVHQEKEALRARARVFGLPMEEKTMQQIFR